MEQTASPSRRTSSRRLSVALILGAAALPFVLGRGRAQQPSPPASSQVKEIDIMGGNQRVAVPACAPRNGDEAGRIACQTITEVLRNDLRFENVRFVPESLMTAIPPQDPDNPNFVDWEGIQTTLLVTT